MWGLTNLPQNQAAGLASGTASDTVLNNREKESTRTLCFSSRLRTSTERERGRGSTQVPSSLVQF